MKTVMWISSDDNVVGDGEVNLDDVDGDVNGDN